MRCLLHHQHMLHHPHPLHHPYPPHPHHLPLPLILHPLPPKQRIPITHQHLLRSHVCPMYVIPHSIHPRKNHSLFVHKHMI